MNMQNNQKEIERLLRDQDFSRRTAGAVLKRAGAEKKSFSPYWAAAAVAVFAAGTFWFADRWAPAPDYAGLSEISTSAVMAEAQTAWEDTDLVINASLVVR